MMHFKQLWRQLGTSPTYLKVESHSRNASLDVSLEEHRLQNIIRKLRRRLFLLGTLLSVCILALATNIVLQHKSLAFETSPISKLPSKIVTFEADKLFRSPASPESDQAWFELIPPGKGFIHVEDPSRFNLKPGLSISADAPGKMYSIAAFHQLDCLSNIRQYLWHLKFAVDTNKTEQLRPILLDPQEDHILSCFDYLRQSVMCAGDTTLEWPAEESNGRQVTVDGWGIPHRCVDWNALLEQTERNAPPAS